MVIGRKFWPIEVGDYRPSSNPPVQFSGSTVAGNGDITGVDPVAVTAMSAIGAANLAIIGWGSAADTVVSAFGVDSITMATPFSGTVNAGTFKYYDKRLPAAGQDQAISAVLCINNSALQFVDVNGNTVIFGAGILVPGAVYYFQIGQVTTATAGDYLGFTSF